MQLVCSDYTETRKNARFKGWNKAKESDFTVLRADASPIADIQWGNASIYRLAIGSTMRYIPRNDVIPTVRLYLDAQRLRKRLDIAETIYIRPEK